MLGIVIAARVGNSRSGNLSPLRQRMSATFPTIETGTKKCIKHWPYYPIQRMTLCLHAVFFHHNNKKVGKCTAIASEVQGFPNHLASFSNLWKSMIRVWKPAHSSTGSKRHAVADLNQDTKRQNLKKFWVVEQTWCVTWSSVEVSKAGPLFLLSPISIGGGEGCLSWLTWRFGHKLNFFCFFLFWKKSLICLEGKSMTPSTGIHYSL